MKNTSLRICLLIVLASICFVACKKTDETKFLSYKEFVNPQVGKFIIYQLDSTITVSFGSSFITKSYLVKDSVVERFYDNQNRESFKIFRYQLDIPTNSWNPINTFYMTPLDTKLEYVENNQRYVPLVNPIADFNSWQGNSQISGQLFNPGNFLSTWTFYYKDVNQPAQIGALNFDKTVTIVQYDSADNSIFNPNSYNQYNKSYEIYADSIGLVYKDILSWEYQQTSSYSNCKLIRPNTGGGYDTLSIDCNLASTNCDSLRIQPNQRVVCDTSLTGYNYNGYGITERILSHN